jgi:ADP-ribose pyrophosphatase YjhB (NUDIX family)
MGAFIGDKYGRILLVKRAIDPKKGYWDVPGGFIEDGENPVMATKREMREELGVTVRVTGLLGVYMDTYFFRYRMNTLNIGYRVSITGGRLRPMSDAGSFKWFTVEQIPWRRLAFRWLTPALRDWMKSRN